MTHNGRNIQDFHRAYEDFSPAENAGMQESCLSSTLSVDIFGDPMKNGRWVWLATWGRASNYWFTFKDAKGRFIPANAYFEKLRIRTERRCVDSDYNVRIKGAGRNMKLHAGLSVIPFPSTFLPILGNVAEELDLAEMPWQEGDSVIKKEPAERMKTLVEAFQREMDRRRRS